MPVRSMAMFRSFSILALVAALAACNRDKPAPEPVETPRPAAIPAVVPAVPEATPTPSARPRPKLDSVALQDRTNPGRLLRYYAAALHARDWGAASRAWGAGSGVTAETLKAAYDRSERPTLEIGEGRQEGAAGSLYYEAPVTLRFGPDAQPETGTLTLRRVNDVDGASAEQLRWHIERVTIGVGQ